MGRNILASALIMLMFITAIPGCKHQQKSKEGQAKEEAKKQKLDFIDGRIVYFEGKLKDSIPAKMRSEMEVLRNFLKTEKEKILAGAERSE